VPPTIYNEEKRKRQSNIYVDHIKPVVDPEVGWTTWDDVIENMFCELDNLQLLCGPCHKIKSQEEIDKAKLRSAKEKLDDQHI
jgi:5-methylcytosine-specific restriction endonuclease McrA